MKLLKILVLVSVLSGCSSTGSLSYTNIGERTANRGELQLTFDELTEFEGNKGLTEQQYAEYKIGYKVGKDSFCDVNNAFQWGLKGNRYQEQCSGYQTEPQFRYEVERGFNRFISPEDKSRH
ncbi:DUF2799 domain-containing protein [Vibrio kyushuensis]|uniref:DUF2799 domain-containing protein n=1 Tax=Vibrio kyushuensis TaxID=2910249 RepID=UPI003D13060C